MTRSNILRERKAVFHEMERNGHKKERSERNVKRSEIEEESRQNILSNGGHEREREIPKNFCIHC